MVALDRLPTPGEMIRHLDAHVAGQERAKRDLAAAVYRHYLGLAARDASGADFGPQHALLLGPTGSGKTLLVRTLAAFLGVPVAFCAATSLVEAGYVGEQVESMLYALVKAAGEGRRPERGIVFLDEFDKVRRATDVGRDVSGEGVQNALLTLLDGTRSRFRYRDTEFALDTSRVLFVCTGAFSGLGDLVRRRLAHRGGMGFGARVRDAQGLPEADALARVTPEDLVAYGIIPELVGRFTTVTAVRPLGIDDLVHVLGGVEGSVLGRWKRQFELHGLELLLEPDAERALAGRAEALGTGARALGRLVGEALQPVAWRLPELAHEGVGAVRVDARAAVGEAEPELVREGPRAEAPFPGAEELRLAALGGAPPGSGMPAAKDLPETALPAAIERLKRELQCQRLRGDRLAAWLEFERTGDPRDVLQVLETLRSRGVPLARFADSLRAAQTAHVPALMLYAAYLEERAKHEARKKPRPTGPAATDDDGEPRLEL